MKKALLYGAVILICAGLYIGWDMKILPPVTQRFMGNWGLHGAGTLAATLVISVLFIALAWVIRLDHKTVELMTLPRLIVLGLFVTVFSMLNELEQYNQPGRVVDVWDVVAQIVGVVFGAIFVYFVGPMKRSRSRDNQKPQAKPEIGQSDPAEPSP